MVDPIPPYAWIVYDPASGDVPLPNDLLFDAEAQRLALPIDEAPSEVERSLRERLNHQDGFSTISDVTFTASAPLDEATVAPAIRVWELGSEPMPVTGWSTQLSSDQHSVTLTPPVGGWKRRGRYGVAVVGGAEGMRTTEGVPLSPDAAMTYLLARSDLTDHPHAFTGSPEERAEAAAALEQTRVQLQPVLARAAAEGATRDQLAAAWTFRVTARPELAFDRPSQRMPVPADLLLDPATGLVSLPPSPDDTDLEAEAKEAANTLAGFGLTSGFSVEASAPLDAATVTDATVQLWDVSSTPVRVAATISVWSEAGRCAPTDDGCVHIHLDPTAPVLEPGATYAVVVREGITDRDGEALLAMPLGQLLLLDHPVAIGGQSQLPSVADADALRVEDSRSKVAALVAQLGDEVVAAWPATTMDPLPRLRDTTALPTGLSYDASPVITRRGPPTRLFGDDPLSDLFPGVLNPAEPLYLPRLDGVAEVVEGTLTVPEYLHGTTRRWREPPELVDVHFMATLPEGVDPGTPIPVVIFGHAIVTDRRFVLTISGELAKRGFMTISLDLPYHGERTHCVQASLVAVPNFFPEPLQPLVGFTEPMIWLPPCASGDDATCAATGECLDANGIPEDFNRFPIVDVLPAAGAAFLDVHDLPHIPDRFRQALVDLGALRHSLQTGGWSTALDQQIRTDRFLYTGQSLGAILGMSYVASDPTIGRAVFNVPGGGLVDVFVDSTFFGPQMSEYLRSIDVEEGTWEHQRLLDVARWLIDSVDPLSVAHSYQQGPPALIQMDRVNASLGDLVIPNSGTDRLAEVSGLPVEEYRSALHGDLVIPLLGDAMLEDLADFLAQGTP
ncbi:MAG: Ig-like domain-containing protein [Myxococcales bacterium]|nr:Ig-like domain-containing protein [Myxococcales bacterium]